MPVETTEDPCDLCGTTDHDGLWHRDDLGPNATRLCGACNDNPQRVIKAPADRRSGVWALPFKPTPAAAFTTLQIVWKATGYADRFAPDAIATGSSPDQGVRIPVTALRSLSAFESWAAENHLADGFAIEIDGMLSPLVSPPGSAVPITPIVSDGERVTKQGQRPRPLIHHALQAIRRSRGQWVWLELDDTHKIQARLFDDAVAFAVHGCQYEEHGNGYSAPTNELWRLVKQIAFALGYNFGGETTAPDPLLALDVADPGELEQWAFTIPVAPIGLCPRCHSPVVDVRYDPEHKGIITVRPDGTGCCSEWEGEFDGDDAAQRQCEITRNHIIAAAHTCQGCGTQPAVCVAGRWGTHCAQCNDATWEAVKRSVVVVRSDELLGSQAPAQEEGNSAPLVDPTAFRLALCVRQFLDGEATLADLQTAWNVCATEHPWW